jgi:hypothetical protein
MELLAQPTTERGIRLLMAHIESLEPEAASARRRLELQLGRELTHKLLFALAALPTRPQRRVVAAA